MNIFLFIYVFLWHILAPLFFLYLWLKGRGEPLYRNFWLERLGLAGLSRLNKPPVWVHTTSLGELRGAVAIIQALLSKDFTVVLSTWTPAGRQAAENLFAKAIENNQIQVVYVPAEWPWAVSFFIRRWRPICLMVTEYEAWPVLINTVRLHKIPLCKANAHYPATSFNRDQRWWGLRSRLFSKYQLIMCKSDLSAQRFLIAGCPNVVVVGETRFDQPVPANLLTASLEARIQLGGQKRPVVCFSSVVSGEDEIFIETMALLKQKLDRPLFIYVPRSPQVFDEVFHLLESKNIKVIRRSDIFDDSLRIERNVESDAVDVLLGDSLGEMYFYLNMSDAVVVGASFVNHGSHNIVEALALSKPVWVGPSIFGIEYPGYAALVSGALHQASDADDLASQLAKVICDADLYEIKKQKAHDFYLKHTGAVDKHMKVFLKWYAELV
jgi:3-deoxy-D-manno-octulosonic-acid transferase